MAVASSLREVAIALEADLRAERPSIRVESSFGASSALARQLELGAPIDLLVSADAELVAALAERGVVVSDSLREIAHGRLVLVTRAGSPFDGSSAAALAALRSPELERLGLPSAAVPLGRYGRAWLEGRGLLEMLEGRIVSTENARANLAAAEQGLVDLAILYESDLRRASTLRPIFFPDPAHHPPIRYVAARATHAPDCPEIHRVLEAWQSERSRSRLEAEGFLLPTEAPSRSRAGARPISEGS